MKTVNNINFLCQDRRLLAQSQQTGPSMGSCKGA